VVLLAPPIEAQPVGTELTGEVTAAAQRNHA